MTKQAGGVSAAIKMSYELGKHDALDGAVKINIQRASAGRYFITVLAGETVPQEWKDLGSIVAEGFPPKQFLLVPLNEERTT